MKPRTLDPLGPAAPPETRARVLIVEDEVSIAGALCEFLTLQGWQVTCAADVPSAVASLTAQRHDVLIADLTLDADGTAGGMDVIRHVRSHSPDTRAIVLTAYGSPEAEEQARRLGVDRFLQKPRPLPEIAAIVAALLDRRG